MEPNHQIGNGLDQETRTRQSFNGQGAWFGTLMQRLQPKAFSTKSTPSINYPEMLRLLNCSVSLAPGAAYEAAVKTTPCTLSRPVAECGQSNSDCRTRKRCHRKCITNEISALARKTSGGCFR